MQYDQDYFSKSLSSAAKTAMDYLVPSFTGTTVWDAIEALFSTEFTTSYADEKANIAGSTGAFSLNISTGLSSFYLLFAYAGPKAMTVFGVFIDSEFLDAVTSNDTGAMFTYIDPYLGSIATAFSGILTSFAGLAVSSASASSAIAPATMASTPTPSSSVNSFASTYTQQVAATNGGSSVPGYAISVIGAFTIIAVFLIVRKKKIAVA